MLVEFIVFFVNYFVLSYSAIKEKIPDDCFICIQLRVVVSVGQFLTIHV